MKSISKIIAILSEEEKREFILQLNRKNRIRNVKNVLLFELLDSNINDDLDIRLYGKPSKNAYHALCKRLQDSLLDYIAYKSFANEISEEFEILKLLRASRIFFEHREYKIAFKTLTRAERIAVQFDIYSILNEIYYTKIQYSFLDSKINLELLIAKADKNMEQLQKETQLNMVYATIKYRLKKSYEKDAKEIIKSAFANFNLEIDKALTYKSLYKLMNITAATGKLQNNFYTVLPLMIDIYNVINQKKDKAQKHIFYHLEILYILSASYFRNKDFKKSLNILKLMENEMDDNKKYYNRFSEKLIKMKALNFNFTGDFNNAIKLLKIHIGDSLDITLILIMCLFQQNKFDEAYQVYKTLNHSDIWYEKKMGWIWVIKKNIIEILLLIELDKMDLVLIRLDSFKKRFGKYLKEIGEVRALTFINLVSEYYKNPKEAITEEFKEKVEVSFEWIGKDREDIFIMSFYAWLKSKMEESDLYNTTLRLVR